MKDVGRRPRGLVLTLVVNWFVKPFTMAVLAVVFFEHLFAPRVDPASASEYIAGMILLGVAPVFAFAPIAALLLGVTEVTVPWETLLLSVALYVVLR